MTLDRNALDRYITGNYGEDQFRDEPECGHTELVFIGNEPNDYDYPELGTHPVYQCKGCGDLIDPPDKEEGGTT